MNKLQAITAFTMVADRGGFSAAASQLNISASAVTKCIARLEDDLGVRLFQRTTRRLALTENGRKFYERCVRILSDLEDAESSMRHDNETIKGRVRIVMPFSFGRVSVIPMLSKFYARHPDIVLDISFSDRPVDLIRDSFEIAVLAGHLEDSGLVRRVLVRGPITTVAAPSYLEKFGVPKTPEDLVHHNCIIRESANWTYRRDGSVLGVNVTGNLWVQSGDAVREAAACGLGVARAPDRLFRNDIKAGQVVRILEEFAPEGTPVSVLYPDKRHLSKKVEAVIQFLFEITQEAPAVAAVPSSVDSESIVPTVRKRMNAGV